MGDSGAMLLGLLLATSTISLTGQIDISQLQDGREGLVPTVLPLVLPLAILALPFLDLTLAFIRRTYAGKWWFLPDKQHLHHRLLERGHSQRRAVMLMYVWSALVSFGVIILGLVQTRRQWTVVAIGVVCALVLMVVTLGRPVRASTKYVAASRCSSSLTAASSETRAERRKRAKQPNRIARRRAEEERRDTLFVPERRRSRRAATRDPRGASVASEAIKLVLVFTNAALRPLLARRDPARIQSLPSSDLAQKGLLPMTVDSRPERAATPADGPSVHVVRARKLLIGGAVGGVTAAAVCMIGSTIGYGTSG